MTRENAEGLCKALNSLGVALLTEAPPSEGEHPYDGRAMLDVPGMELGFAEEHYYVEYTPLGDGWKWTVQC